MKYVNNIGDTRHDVHEQLFQCQCCNVHVQDYIVCTYTLITVCWYVCQ